MHMLTKFIYSFFSHTTPNLTTVLPAMDLIDEWLTIDSLNASCYSSAIHASLGVAKCTLNCYYSMTDWSELYHIAMGKLFYHYYYYCTNTLVIIID